ncbi:MAG: iron ABC transporter permease [Candidatus Omnitrophota bacterium]
MAHLTPIAFGMHRALSLPAIGCLGSVLVTCAVYFISSKWKGLKITSILLTGVMFSFICSSLIMLILSVSRAYQAHRIIFWMMGSLSENNPAVLAAVSAVILTVSGFSIANARTLNAISLGEEEAMHLGVDMQKAKAGFFILSSVLAGAAVSVSGIIGFVGLVVPHFIRMFAGSDHRILMPASFLLGGIFLVICDTIARTAVAPVELPVGVITGILGGSIFVYFLIKGRQVIWKK